MAPPTPANGMACKPKLPQATVLAPRPPTDPDAADCIRPVARKRTRASKPKVKTGCKTCKIRRIKCDETKPICQQCQKARIVCDGYDDGLTSQLTGISNLEPEPGVCAKTSLVPSRDKRRAYLPRPLPSSGQSLKRFNANEVSYFDFFRYELTNDLCGYCCTDFWSRVVLCEAMTKDCVRHAVLAIAALAKGVSDSLASTSAKNQPSALFPWTAKSIVNNNHHVALRYYVEALSTFRKQVNNKDQVQSPRAVLIMTMLLITFELLQGNMEMVDTLMTSSINLLKGSLGQYRHSSSIQHHEAQARTEEDVRDIEHMLPFLSIMGGWTPFLKTQRSNLALWDTSAGGGVPNLGYRSSGQLQADWSRFFARASAFTGQALTAVMQEQSVVVNPALLHEQMTYLSHLDKWQNVLDVGLAQAITARDNHAKMAFKIMQLHHLMVRIGVNCCLDYTDMIWDAYDDEFLVLVERCLAFAIEARPAYRARFTLSMGILSTLGPAIAKCRNHNIRMRALEMARRMPWREGAWDAEAELFGKLGAVLLEERGRDSSGIISPENRWTWVDGSWDLELNNLTGQYVRSVPDQSGNPVITTLELALDAWPDICRDISCDVDHAVECRIMD
ncbi:hypothetical protein B0T25DRAFT_536270 [Lasiosphaeria hispida]|uniref:Zn(2)-C6 fungal-type domain-containing protein n=1 Tax=Lasiosphaeria hispida TaxID=260671 RepID=A0AAJ0MIW4_9PEZI|nr:hypothetical protein B0T25DRAFT_536270 [Lasiosphaeria hispida]